MKIIIVLMLLMFVTTLSVNAAEIKPRSYKKEYKIKRKEFLARHGKDSMTRAVINMFYRKRRNSIVKSCMFILLPASIGGGLALDFYLGRGGDLILPVFAMLFGLVIGLPSLILSITGIIQLFTFNREQLYWIIKEHEKGKPFDEKLLKKLKKKDFERN